jgi:hypothetical protein
VSFHDLFTSDDVYSYASNGYPLFGGNSRAVLDNELLLAVLQAVLSNTSIPLNILSAGTSSSINLGRNLERYYEYGRDKHTYGLPNSAKIVTTYDVTVAEARDFLASVFSVNPSDLIDVEINYTKEVPLNFEASIYLQNNLYYNSYSNTFDIQETIDNGTIKANQWNIDPADVGLYTSRLDSTEITREQVRTGATEFTGVYTLNTTITRITIADGTEYPFVAKNIFARKVAVSEPTPKRGVTFSFKPSGINEIREWFYYIGSNLYPVLEQKLTRQEISIGEDLYPVLPFRVSGEVVDSNYRYSDIYKESVALARTLNLDFDQVSAEFEKNDSKNKLVSTYAYLGVNFNSKNQYELQYLFDYFTDPEVTQNIGSDVGNFDISFEETSQFASRNLRKYLTFGKVKTTDVSEKLYPTDKDPLLVYTTDSAYADLSFDEKEEARTLQKKRGTWFVGTPGKLGCFRVTLETTKTPVFKTGKGPNFPIVTKKYILEKQTGNSSYTRVVIENPKLYTIVRKGEGIYKTLDSILASEDDFRLFLQRSRLQNYSRFEQAQLIAFAIVVESAAYDKQTLRFFEDSSFATFLEVVGYVVTFVVTFYSPEGGAAVGAIFQRIIIGLAIQLAIELVSREISKRYGPKAGAIFKAIATIAVAATTASVTDTSLATADIALLAVQSVTTVADGIINEELLELLQDVEDFEDWSEAKLKELQERQDSIETPLDVSIDGLLSLLVNEDIIFSEAPVDFLTRSLNANPGADTVNYANNYLNLKLQLPDYLKDRVGVEA